MSLKVYGILKFADAELQINKQIELSFLIVESAAKNKMGVKVGGNVEQKNAERFKNLFDKLPFELTDDPIDINAECLFAGDGIQIRVSGTRVDSGEPLISRMSRVQNFLKELAENNTVDQIILDINIEDGDEFETVEVNVDEFSETMIALYEKEGNWTPTIRLVIIKTK